MKSFWLAITFLAVLSGFSGGGNLQAQGMDPRQTLDFFYSDAPEKDRLRAMCNLASSYLRPNPAQSLVYTKLADSLARKMEFKPAQATVFALYASYFDNLSLFDSALIYLDKSYEIYDELDSDPGRASIYGAKASAFQEMASFDLAEENDLKALELFHELKDTVAISFTLSNLGNNELRRFNYSKALEYYILSVRFKELSHNFDGYAYSLNGIGMVYYRMHNYDKAKEYLERAMGLFDKDGNRVGVANAMNNLGLVYRNLNDYDTALALYREALAIVTDYGEKSLRAYSNFCIGDVLMEMGREEDAAPYIEDALALDYEVGNRQEECALITTLANIKSTLGEYALAEQYFRKADTISSELGDEFLRNELFDMWANHHARIGNYERAYFLRNEHLRAKDSLRAVEERNQTAELIAQFESERKDIEIEKLTAENDLQDLRLQRNRIANYAILIGASLIIIIVVLWGQRNRYRTRERSLILQQKLLQAQMNPHFIFNSLNSIQRFVLNNETDSAYIYLEKFGSLLRRILENSGQDSHSLQDEIDLMELYLALESLRFDSKFEYEIKVDQSLDRIGTRIPSMLIQPYIENSIWHGLLPKEGEGKISLEFSRKGDNLLVTISDNGIGRKAAMERKARRSESHKSLGMAKTRERIDLIARHREGHHNFEIIDLHDEHGKACGTVVKLSIPIHS